MNHCIKGINGETKSPLPNEGLKVMSWSEKVPSIRNTQQQTLRARIEKSGLDDDFWLSVKNINEKIRKRAGEGFWNCDVKIEKRDINECKQLFILLKLYYRMEGYSVGDSTYIGSGGVFFIDWKV